MHDKLHLPNIIDKLYCQEKKCPMKANQWAMEAAFPSSDLICLLHKKISKLEFSSKAGFLEAVNLDAVLYLHTYHRGHNGPTY